MKIDKLYEPFHKSNFPVSLEYKEAIKIAGLDNRNAEEEWRSSYLMLLLITLMRLKWGKELKEMKNWHTVI